MREATVYGNGKWKSPSISCNIRRRCVSNPINNPNRVSLLEMPKPQRLQVVCMAVKRSPKRLKYSAPRFSKDGYLVYVEVDPTGADTWQLDPVIQLLKDGAVGVIPTDTLYAIVCRLKSNSAIERLRRIKNIEPSKPLNILCRSLRDIDTYTTGFPRGDGQGHANIFRAVKHCLPGPYTFILTASKELPKQCVRYGTTTPKYSIRKNVGVRIPDDAICQAILANMDVPLISTSVKWLKDNEWMIDPVVIADIYGPEGLDFVVDAGVRTADPSTVVDMTGTFPKIIRQGVPREVSFWMPSLISYEKLWFNRELPGNPLKLFSTTNFFALRVSSFRTASLSLASKPASTMRS